MSVNFVEKTDNLTRITNLLASVSDKSGLDVFVKDLIRINPDITIYSTGGTFTFIRNALGEQLADKHLKQVSDYTGQPEMQGGLVKTLDFKIYMGLLSETYNQAHQDDMKRAEAINLDMVIVNLYPFSKAVQTEGTSLEQARANIDIGGPCMARASAKNYLRVASVVNSSDYPALTRELEANNGCITLATRFELAKKTFQHTANYDSTIAEYLLDIDFTKAKACYKIQAASAGFGEKNDN